MGINDMTREQYDVIVDAFALGFSFKDREENWEFYADQEPKALLEDMSFSVLVQSPRIQVIDSDEGYTFSPEELN